MNFDREKYKEEMSAFSLSDEQKTALKARLYRADEPAETKRINSGRVFIKVAAAAVAVCVLTVGVFYGFSGTGEKTSPTFPSISARNPFVITANAAEISEKYKDEKLSDSTIAVYSDSAGMGWLLDGNSSDGAYRKDGHIDYFTCYDMSAFRVTGKDIQSVTLSSNKKGIYFTVTPYARAEQFKEYDMEKAQPIDDEDAFYYEGKKVYIDQDALDREREEETARYTFGELNNSQYTKDELNEYNDGIGREFFADGFTYKNTKGEQTVNMDNAIGLMIESDHGDSEIAKWLDEIWELEQRSISLRDAAINGTDGGEQDRVCGEMEKLSERIIKKMLKGATINVEVKYSDGSSEARELDIGAVNFEGIEKPLLTLGELEFDEATGEYK